MEEVGVGGIDEIKACPVVAGHFLVEALGHLFHKGVGGRERFWQTLEIPAEALYALESSFLGFIMRVILRTRIRVTRMGGADNEEKMDWASDDFLCPIRRRGKRA